MRLGLSSTIISRDKADTLLLLTACLAVLLPHSTHVAWWVSPACGAMLAWRAWLTLTGRRLPKPWILLPIAALLMVGVYTSFHTFLGREAGVTMLVLLLTCKLLEMHAKRDLFVVLFLSFFLLLTSFFYQQTIISALVALLATSLLLTAQVSFQYTGLVPSLKQKGRLIATLLGCAIPLTLCAFLLFPRIQGPLWGLPGDAHQGRSGLSESMAPGGISDLVLSEDIVFRAKFDQPITNKSVLYWRGVVMNDFDGKTWRAAPAINQKRLSDKALAGKQIKQEIILEPQGQRWLFGLETPTIAPTNNERNIGELTSYLELRSNEPIVQRLRYEITSAPDFRSSDQLLPLEREQSLELPSGYNPRMLQLATDLRQRYQSDTDLINAVLHFFTTQEFSYTLEPPLLGVNSVDDFLFKSKAGFCEHYASAFVNIMRAADIPARIVTGYQGGFRNDVDGYFEIRQSDAHAWAEVWLPNQGWVRVDPTAAVAPERVMQNLAGALPQRGLAGLVGKAFSGFSWVKGVQMRWNAINNSWNQWVLNYNQNTQRNLLDRLGFKNIDWAQLSLLFFVTGTLFIAVVALPLTRNKTTVAPLDRVYFSFCIKMAKYAAPRTLHEGPQAYLQRLRLALPAEQLPPVERFLHFYIAAKYGKHVLSDHSAAQRLKALLAACH